MADEKEDPARQQRAYLEKWIENDDKQRALRPAVVRMLGSSTWQVTAMDALRTKSPDMAREVDGELAASLTALKERLPLPIEYADEVNSTSTAVASTALVFDALVAVREPRSESDVDAQIIRYEELAGEQGRADEAGRRVARLFPNLADRFSAAQNAAQAALDQQDQEGAAFQMRTFIDKLKGELWSKAAKYMGENMTWELMAERLSPATGAHILRDQGATHSSLISALSDIGKARSSAYSFKETWTRFVDHVFIVCGEVLAGAAPRP